MKKVLLVFFSLLSASTIYSQVPSIEWQHSYGGSNDENCRVIKQTSDLGFIVAGFSKSNNGNLTVNYGNNDGWIIKLAADGTIQWQKSFGGAGEDYIYDIIQTSDGGYIACGGTYSNIPGHHGVNDYWVIKLDALGTMEWQQVYGGQYMETAQSITQIADGGYVFVADSTSDNGQVTGLHGASDYWVVRINNSGVLLWQKTFGGSSSDFPRSIIKTSEGGFLVVGSSTSTDGDITLSHGGFEYWIIKLSISGIIEWQKSFGGSSDDQASRAIQTADGGFLITGSAYSSGGQITGNHGMNDVWVIKTDNMGNLIWQKCYGGSNLDYSHSLLQTADGNYVIGGRTVSSDGDVASNHGGQDAWILKIDPAGNLLWEKTFGGSGSDSIFSITNAPDGGIASSGISSSSNGDVTFNHGLTDFWIAKYDAAAMTTGQFVKNQIQIVPNPATTTLFCSLVDSTTIEKIDITDLFGKHILTIDNSNEINIDDFPVGVYILQAFAGDYSYTTKFIKQ